MTRGIPPRDSPVTGLRAARALILLTVLLGLIRPSCPCSAQTTPIGTIELYGLQHVSAASVRQALQLTEGDTAPESSAATDTIKTRLRAVPGVQNVQINGVCCVAGKTALFVGIEEKGARPLRFRAAPTGKVFLSKEVVQAGEEFQTALMEAIRQGDSGEDDSQGYSLMHNAAARAVQQRFLIFATRDPKRYQDVLLHSSDSAHRALAAQVLGYAEPEDQTVVNDLVQAMSDPDSNVRNNAMRALAVRDTYVQITPTSRLKIPFDPFIRMLNSLDWTDRNKAGFALLQLSQHRDVALLKSLRKEALPALKEMANWQRSGYGQPAFILLGRIVGLSDDVIVKAWQQGDYSRVLTALQGLQGS